MSVINKMLRDLDQRNNSAASANQIIARRHGQPLWLTLLLLLTFGLLCFAIYAVLSRSAVVPTADLATTAPEPVAQQLPREPGIATEIAISARPESNSLEPINSPEPTDRPGPTDSLASLQAAASAHSAAAESIATTTITAPELPVQAVANVAAIAAQPGQQRTEPDDTAAPVPQLPEIAQAAVPPAAKAGSSLSVTSREPTAAQQQAKLRQQALAATQAGQPQQALRYWQQLQQAAPQDAVVYLAQARLWLQLGQPQQAEASLLQAKTQGIVDADIQLMLAQAAASRQQWLQTEALLPAGFAVALHPDYYGLKATALQQLGQHQQAFDWFAELSRLQPQLGKWWLGGAVSLEALERPAEAHQYYLNALQWGDNLSVQSKTYIQQRLVATE
ncbi:tetratricopeptide (TPR) repeat protein [Rheinheimera pacifica]|uniref:tetratricopeptide repeat protein n=1 Tax=Rheinheimera pacifica TaxID=173990 RepID=UPI002169354B|nr:tetratricopeptide repeat protein [Rheinheimera pacifica]MCS4308883.1 tetratricopeptide (TPR) repeat protein [Rheinheimera pacifica]